MHKCGNIEQTFALQLCACVNDDKWTKWTKQYTSYSTVYTRSTRNKAWTKRRIIRRGRRSERKKKTKTTAEFDPLFLSPQKFVKYTACNFMFVFYGLFRRVFDAAFWATHPTPQLFWGPPGWRQKKEKIAREEQRSSSKEIPCRCCCCSIMGNFRNIFFNPWFNLRKRRILSHSSNIQVVSSNTISEKVVLYSL